MLMSRRIDIERIRNIGIIAHVDAGKTTLTERVLFHTGRIHAMGEVHQGTTRTDHHPIEQRKGITIMAAAVTCDWRGHRIHLVDTPGHVDFTIEVERSLRVLDGAVVVLDGVAGVEPQTETVWRQADRHRVPRLVFVNKLDRRGADFRRCLDELRRRLNARPIAVTLPMFDGDELVGVVDVVRQHALVWHGEGPSQYRSEPVPASLFDIVNQAREQLLEACADADEHVLDAIVHGRSVAPELLDRALRQATVRGQIVPVLAGSAYRHRGVEPLLDAAAAYLPSPRDRGFVRGIDGGEREPSLPAPLAALAFKVVFDDHGQMTFVRVYSGVLEKGMTVLAARAGRKLRVGRVVQLLADEREEVSRLEAGEIGAVLALPLAGGETLSSPDAPIVLESIVAPAPVMRVAVEAKTSADRARLGVALGRMVAADPSLHLESDADTGQTLLAGMGQLHLEIAVERLATEHGVSVTMGAPRVAYRSTLRRVVTRELRYVKQSGGPGQWAHVVIEVGPAARGAGFVFEDRVRGGAIPREYVAGVEKGVREAIDHGLLGGHAVVDVRVTLLDGATHSNDSSELAFKMAGSLAFRDAAADADPCLLEPLMLLEVSCPEDQIGTVVGDVMRRRGTVIGIEARGDERALRAEVPLAELFGYAGALSGLTHGRGRFTMEPARYEEVPDALAKAIARSSS
jgi:elongation factor G